MGSFRTTATRGVSPAPTTPGAGEDERKPFEEKMERLSAELWHCFTESDWLGARIRANLEELGYG